MYTMPVISPPGDWSGNSSRGYGSVATDCLCLFDVYEQTHEKKGNAALVDRFGSHEPPNNFELDYVCHMALGITISQVDTAHEDRNIYIIVHVNKKLWRKPEENPSTFIAYKVKGIWRLIPIA